MIKKISLFFFNLTKANWGLTYHFIIANQLMFWLGGIFPPPWVGFGIVLLGTGYMVYQFKSRTENNFGALTDAMAEWLGILIGILQLIYGG